MNMKDILKDEQEFKHHFNSQTLQNNLKGLSLDTLRGILLELYDYVPFSVARTPRHWAVDVKDEENHQPVIVIGHPNPTGHSPNHAGVRMDRPRIGLCTGVASENDARSLYLWTDLVSYDGLLDDNPIPSTWEHWCYTGGENNPDPSPSHRTSFSLIDSNRVVIPFNALCHHYPDFKKVLQKARNEIALAPALDLNLKRNGSLNLNLAQTDVITPNNPNP